jgi:hypothetical protein
MHVAKLLLERGDEVVGVDNLNDYYDPRLKLARLEQLKPFAGFRFIQTDIADRMAMEDLKADGVLIHMLLGQLKPGDIPADVRDAFVQEQLLCERLQQLLGIRNGARPDDREACKLTLHCKSVDSVHGHGVAELRGWLYRHCRSLRFMGEMEG